MIPHLPSIPALDLSAVEARVKLFSQLESAYLKMRLMDLLCSVEKPKKGPAGKGSGTRDCLPGKCGDQSPFSRGSDQKLTTPNMHQTNIASCACPACFSKDAERQSRRPMLARPGLGVGILIFFIFGICILDSPICVRKRRLQQPSVPL